MIRRQSITTLTAALLLLAAACGAPLLANGFDLVKPAQVGLSEERLALIGEVRQGYVDRGEAAGSLALVARHGKIAYFEHWGMSDRERKSPMKPDTIFRIYSMTKPITSVAVMILFEEARFSLTDPVSTYLPELKDLEVTSDERAPESGEVIASTRRARNPVTIQDLLRHTGGFTYGFFGNSTVDRKYREAGILLREENVEETVAKLGKLPLLYEPGTRWHYSIGIDILGRLVEVVSGMPFDRFLQERIFEPLDMVDTGFTVPPDKLSRFAQLYAPKGTTNRAEAFLERNPSKEIQVADAETSRNFQDGATFHSGGGGLVSTALDYLRFSSMILNGGVFDGRRILSRKTVELMAADHLVDVAVGMGDGGAGFGLGFRVIKDLGATGAIGSPGELSWGGAAGTRFFIDPKEKLIGIFMTQIIPHRTRMGDQFRQLTYQAIVD